MFLKNILIVFNSQVNNLDDMEKRTTFSYTFSNILEKLKVWLAGEKIYEPKLVLGKNVKNISKLL